MSDTEAVETVVDGHPKGQDEHVLDYLERVSILSGLIPKQQAMRLAGLHPSLLANPIKRDAKGVIQE